MSTVTIGRFEIVRELGKSELGTVYKAFDPKKKRTVALRVLRADTPESIERSRQYLLQARAASVLDSPNIVSVYAGAEEQGLTYVVMEYIEGITLETALRAEQGWSASELIDISRQVCRALDHAHSKGIFHASLAPGRIITEWDGTVKIMEFGFDWAMDGSPAQELHYMSPEQVQGQPPDARSNIFSWGAILYEMVTGKQAFAGDAESVRRSIQDEDPPAPDVVNPKIPACISQVIMKALAKSPGDRFASGAELVEALETEYRSARSSAVAPGVPQVAAAPRLEPRPAPPTIPGLSPKLDAAPPAAPVPLQVAPPPIMTPRVETRPTVAAAPRSAADLPEVAPLPKAERSGSFALTPQQVKILVGVIGGALLLLIGGITIDSIHSHHQHVQEVLAEAQRAEVPPPAPPVVQQLPAVPAPAEEEAPVRRAAKPKPHKVAAAPLPGELTIGSNPDGARVQVDGAGAWTTPVSLSSLTPGPHVIVLSKPGYAAETRSILVQAGSRSVVTISLTPLPGLASIASDPPGAAILIDGRDTGKVTPAKLSVERGTHSVVLRRTGYLEASTSVNLGPGETFQFVPTLKPLGNAEDIRQVGKLKKILARGTPENAARVQVRTFPKGAQIMFNQRMMDHASPAEFFMGPGTYEVTFTLSGYKPIRRVVTIEPGARLELDETFEK
jgi:hypothetical protein